QVLPPGLLLFAIVLCLNLVADSYSESLNRRPSHATLVRQSRGRITPRSNESLIPAVTSEIPPLQIRNLTIEVENGLGTKLVEDVSFDVRLQEVVAVVGESGSGKTMTALAVMGMLPEGLGATQGSIEVLGKNIIGMAPAELRQLRSRSVGVVFQDPLSCMD